MIVDATELEWMLEEWGRWAVYHDEAIGPELPACASLEGQYSSPQCWEANPIRADEPDWRTGEAVEAAWRGMRDQRAKRLLRVWYVMSQWMLSHDDRLMWEKRMALCEAQTPFARDTIETLLDMARRDILNALQAGHGKEQG